MVKFYYFRLQKEKFCYLKKGLTIDLLFLIIGTRNEYYKNKVKLQNITE